MGSIGINEVIVGQRLHLNRVFSKFGICSRSQASAYISEGSVSVNNSVTKDPKLWVDIEKDCIVFRNRELKSLCSLNDQNTGAQISGVRLKYCYLAMHKPRGYVCTRTDPDGRKTIFDLLPDEYKNQWFFPVGRLDMDSEGLLLFTNDGTFSDLITDPHSHVQKTYHVLLDINPHHDYIQMLCSGILLDGKSTLPCQIYHNQGKWFTICLHEGRNRQIRRMFWSIGCRVKRLIRIQIGECLLKDLPSGHTRMLSNNELQSMYHA